MSNRRHTLNVEQTRARVRALHTEGYTLQAISQAIGISRERVVAFLGPVPPGGKR